jgi:RNA polymerase sigma factor (sigma-70 family)
MIGKKDLETGTGKAEFEEYRKAAERFIKSKIFRQTDAEDLAQETGMRVLEKLSHNENLKVNAGYFIQTARNVLLEHYRRQTAENRRNAGNDGDGETETEKPLDADSRLKDFDEQKEKTIFLDCMLECLEQRALDEQLLLLRYSVEEKHPLDDEEPDSYKNFFASFLDSIRAVRDKILALPDDYSPLTKNAKVKIFRLRTKLKSCRAECIARKKGFA